MRLSEVMKLFLVQWDISPLKIATVVESGRNMKVEAEMLSAVAEQEQGYHLKT